MSPDTTAAVVARRKKGRRRRRRGRKSRSRRRSRRRRRRRRKVHSRLTEEEEEEEEGEAAVRLLGLTFFFPGDCLQQQKTQEERAREDCWDLIFHGKEIKKEVLQQRFWLKKNLLTELRAGRPYSMRDALLVKLGVYTNVYLSSQDKSKNAADKARLKSKQLRSPGAKSAKKTAKEKSVSDDDDSSSDDDADEDE